MDKEIEILIVEDSLTQAEKLKYILEKNKYKVYLASNGVEALEMIKRKEPTLVITDITMPEMNGYELCEKIKEDEKLKHIPVLILTSLSDPCDVIEGLKVKADNFITKPYNEKFLLSRIKQLLMNLEMRKYKMSEIGIEVYFAGEKRFINSERIQIIDLLLSTFENAVQKTQELEESNRELTKALEFIKKLERNYRAIIESSTSALIVLGYDGVIRYANPAAKALLGTNLEEILGEFLDFDEIGEEEKEITITLKDGTSRITKVDMKETTWEGEDACIVSIRDVTQEVQLREKLKAQSLTDELTGLYNRRGFSYLAEHNVKLAKRSGKDAALFFIDLDKLKSINDALGHNKGDMILIGAANVLRATFRESDILARIGGDEFVVLSMNTDEEGIYKITKRLDEKIREYNEERGMEYILSMSIGALKLDMEQPFLLDEWLSKADQLMYENKKSKITS